MIEGKQICPAGHGSGLYTESHPGRKAPVWLRKIRSLFHTASAAVSGDSSKVMDRCMKYHREHRGA